MTASSTQPQVLTFDPASDQAAKAVKAYPLTLPVYAAASPYITDATLRRVYADFVRYAAEPGQIPGVQSGQLPGGYAPLPDSWRVQARAAATALENGITPTSPTPPSTTTTNSGPGVSSGAASGATRGTGTSASNAAAPAAGSPAAPAAAGSADPQATGAIAAALAGAKTAADPDSGALPAALPISLLAGLIAALVVLLIPRLPRRA
jgi:hypothetical protein